MSDLHLSLRSGHRGKLGMPPGSLVYVGPDVSGPARITVIDYDPNRCARLDNVQVSECAPYHKSDTVTWINIDGVHDLQVLETVGRQFDIPPLLLADIAHTGQRPKVEEAPGLLFVVMVMVRYDPAARAPTFEQVSMVVTQRTVITFQEREGDVFDPVRERILNGKGRIRRMNSDYLAYSLMDMIVDHMFAVLEELSERIEAVDGKVLSNPTSETLHEIHRLKLGMIMMRKAVWPLRDVLSNLSRGDNPLIGKQTLPYFHDLFDHCMRVIETLETYRELMSGLLDTYLSTVSNRTNEVMKVLTIMATIFIPLTFIVGVYGMNFEHMPELHWRFGYGLVWIVNALVVALMLAVFRRKRWI